MPVKPKRIICSNCGKDRRETARGLCATCYRITNHIKTNCIDCNQYKCHYAHGRCQACHSKWRRIQNPEYFKVHDKKKYDKLTKDEKHIRNQKIYLSNTDKFIHYSHRKKARNAGLIYDLTYTQWLQILKEHNHICYYCHNVCENLQREHKVPVSRGGGYTYSNIVAACQSCNLKKGTMTDIEFFAILEN